MKASTHQPRRTQTGATPSGSTRRAQPHDDPTAAQFADALRRLGPTIPAGIRAALEAHQTMPGRAATATVLAEAVGYRDFRGINLGYGRLARQLAEAIGCAPRTPHLLLLAEFAEPATLTNRHWVLMLRPAFVAGWERAGLATGP